MTANEFKVSEKIKNRRLELGLTIKDVANALGTADSTVSRYETSNIKNMKVDKVLDLANVLQCSPADLLGWTESAHFTDVNSAIDYLKSYDTFTAFGGKKEFSDATILEIANIIYKDKMNNNQ